jgi:hypothetical protein
MAGNWIRRLFGSNEGGDDRTQLALPNPAAPSRTATDITVLDLEGRGNEFGMPDDAGALYNGQQRQLALFRPPVTLDNAGQSAPDVDRQLIADYMSTQIGHMADMDLGPVRIDWKGRRGRFVSAFLHMITWQQGFTVILPVQMISVQVEQIYKLYQQAMALKVREMHKGHQDHSQANTLLDKAARHLERLRDDGHPHLTDAEFMFLAAAISRARIVNELLPMPVGGEELVLGQTATVLAPDGRQPSGSPGKATGRG